MPGGPAKRGGLPVKSGTTVTRRAVKSRSVTRQRFPKKNQCHVQAKNPADWQLPESRTVLGHDLELFLSLEHRVELVMIHQTLADFAEQKSAVRRLLDKPRFVAEVTQDVR